MMANPLGDNRVIVLIEAYVSSWIVYMPTFDWNSPRATRFYLGL